MKSTIVALFFVLALGNGEGIAAPADRVTAKVDKNPLATAMAANAPDLKRVPHKPEVVLAFLAAGEPAKAEALAIEILADHPEDWQNHVAYVKAALDAGSGWRVLAEYRALRSRGDATMRLLAAWVEMRVQGSAGGPQIREAFEQAAAASPEVGQILLGEQLVSDARYADALVLLDERMDPDAVRVRLSALVRSPSGRKPVDLARSALALHPQRPDMGVGLWGADLSADVYKGSRKLAVDQARTGLRSSDAAVLFRSWELLAWAREKEDAGKAASRLADKVPGLLLPDRLPYGNTMTRHLGDGLARSPGAIDDLRLTPPETRAVLVAKARAIRETGNVAATRQAYEEALAQDSLNPAVLLEYSEYLLVPASRVDPEPDVSRARDLAVKARYALGCIVPASPALTTEQDWLLMRSFALEAQAAETQGKVEEALGLLNAATRIHADPALLVMKARLQEGLGARESALHSYAMAVSAGRAEVQTEVKRLYSGPARPEDLWSATLPSESAAPPGQWKPVVETATAERPLAGWTLSSEDGELNFDALRDKVVVVVFWASWCGPCQEEIPAIAQVAKTWKAAGLPFELVAVSVDERDSDYRRGVTRLGDLGVRYAWSPELGRKLGLQAIPAAIVVDGQGQLLRRFQGYDPESVHLMDELVRGGP